MLKREEEINKMFNITTNIPLLDEENANLFAAATLLQRLGNAPGLTTNAFYAALLSEKVPAEQHESLTLAAIAIEAMMSDAEYLDSYGTEH